MNSVGAAETRFFLIGWITVELLRRRCIYSRSQTANVHPQTAGGGGGGRYCGLLSTSQASQRAGRRKTEASRGRESSEQLDSELHCSKTKTSPPKKTASAEFLLNLPHCSRRPPAA